ncbi:MAG: ABC transporter ATP-binding protein, partial [Burkholderiaceae bacterium]|nr:ABC transporter ATP-binding protein [Burkholderiaceae bacterium]
MAAGAERLAKYKQARARENTLSGGGTAGFSRIAVPGEVDLTHGRILYLEDVHV